MKSRMRGWLALGAMAASVSTSAGCSCNGTAQPPEKVITVAAPTPPKPLRVALAGSYVPLHFPRAGQMEGLEADLARLIGQRLGRPVEFINPRSLSLDSVSAIAQGKVDLGLNSISPTESRRQQVDFTQPYVMISYRFAGGESCDSMVPDDAAGLAEVTGRVAVPKGPALEAAQRVLPQATLIPTTSSKLAVTAVQEDEADCALDEDVGLLQALEGTSLRIVGVEAGQSSLAIAVPKGQAATYDAVLRDLQPRLAELMTKWQPGQMKAPIPGLADAENLGVLCNVHEREVELREAPEWSASVRESWPCGTVVEILRESENRTPARQDDGELFGGLWFQVRVAANGKRGWAYGHDLFSWLRADDPEFPTTTDIDRELIGRKVAGRYAFGLALDQYSPSSEDDGPEMDEDLALPFLYMKGAPFVAPLHLPDRTDASWAHIPDSAEWMFLVLNSAGGSSTPRSISASSLGLVSYKIQMNVGIGYQDGGARATLTGEFAENTPQVSLTSIFRDE
ncbi:substrate-binding periplasmic protein [Archangium lansingense]|uniref:Transporter substrate-binding domain-containing protein n=1 Tax=Archangium lansingense TaxID=2995310 RepID=A0ABT4A2L2_9BACT|nr:transporter substrate-binding domain-containing protein [Archangium lansinium]MCY1075884.1 transporter substrate-binding domain-containing protein [Archangium lansinium]